MTNSEKPPSPPRELNQQDREAIRLAEKRAENLRQNLMKRKVQIRARDAQPTDTESSSPED